MGPGPSSAGPDCPVYARLRMLNSLFKSCAMPDGRVEDTVGDNVHDLGQQACPASALAMVINSLRKGIIMGG